MIFVQFFKFLKQKPRNYEKQSYRNLNKRFFKHNQLTIIKALNNDKSIKALDNAHFKILTPAFFAPAQKKTTRRYQSSLPLV